MSSAIAMVRRSVSHRVLMFPMPSCLREHFSWFLIVRYAKGKAVTHRRRYITVVSMPSIVLEIAVLAIIVASTAWETSLA